jgi:hypothetical protein
MQVDTVTAYAWDPVTTTACEMAPASIGPCPTPWWFWLSLVAAGLLLLTQGGNRSGSSKPRTVRAVRSRRAPRRLR